VAFKRKTRPLIKVNFLTKKAVVCLLDFYFKEYPKIQTRSEENTD